MVRDSRGSSLIQMHIHTALEFSSLECTRPRGATSHALKAIGVVRFHPAPVALLGDLHFPESMVQYGPKVVLLGWLVSSKTGDLAQPGRLYPFAPPPQPY